MKTLEQRMRDVAASLPATARMFVPAALVDLLIDLCKTADQGAAERARKQE